MDKYICCIIIALILILLYETGHLNFNESMACSNLDGNCYKIVSSFKKSSHSQAADQLAKINGFNARFITYLRNKYLWNDNVSSSLHTQDMQEITKNLIANYNPTVLKENNPDSEKNTSYVLEKGASVAFCLRRKDPKDPEAFEDDNTLIFVNIHEIAHLGMSYHDPSHNLEFWKTFKLLQQEAIESGLYKPINYRDHPTNYCGVYVDYNPFFDNNLVVS